MSRGFFIDDDTCDIAPIFSIEMVSVDGMKSPGLSWMLIAIR
jgi:hypothetical protein